MKTPLTVFVLVLGVALVGCGDDDDSANVAGSAGSGGSAGAGGSGATGGGGSSSGGSAGQSGSGGSGGAAASGGSGGSSTGGSGGSGGSVLPSNVSFATQVVPILTGSCVFSGSCHGDPNASGHVQLGAGGLMPSAVRMNLIDKPSQGAPSMPLVTAGDSANSFLYHKLTGDFSGVTCATDCGDRMPQGFPNGIAQTKIDTIKVWIDEGAKDN